MSRTHEQWIRLRFAAVGVLAALLPAMIPSVAHAGFGVASFGASASSTQAGAHPDLSSSFTLNEDPVGNPIGQIKKATVTLPPGVIGNTQAIERCSTQAFEQVKCPQNAQVGILNASFIVCRGVSTPLEATAEAGATVLTVSNTAGLCAEEANNDLVIGSGPSAETVRMAYVLSPTTVELTAPLEHTHSAGEVVVHVAKAATIPIPLFNLQPAAGHVATLGASILLATIMVQVDVSPDGRLTAALNEISTLLPLSASELTLWGVPADASHDKYRCNELGFTCGTPGGTPVPFTTNSTDCGGPSLETNLELESWQGQSVTSSTTEPAPTGCEVLHMSPKLRVSTDTTQRDAPAGYGIELEVPQAAEPYGLATPDLRDVEVTFPAGTSLSPGLANGLQACSDAQFAAGSCPNASKVGTAEITTPLLATPLSGAIYIGAPTPTEKYRLLVSVSTGDVTLDLAGQVQANEATGQVTTVFTNVQQLPFSDLKLSLFGGPSAALANPESCGAATSTAQITSYAGQSAGPSSSFTVDADGAGGACSASLPFAPSFNAGTTVPVAGRPSPFTLTFSRADGQQDLSTFAAKLPPGLVGMLKSATPCPEPQAAAGACSQASQVGTATIGAGSGSAPLYISGPVYLTGPYNGAPFGLATVVDATAGPFDLGRVVVRSRILIDPSDLALTVASDPFPQILSGIPLRLRTVNVSLDRPGFIVNPTDCSAMAVTAAVGAGEGASAAVSTPFQVAGCAGLRFAPRLSASTRAKASIRGNGASLDVDVVNPAGSTATPHSVIIEMPTQLRPRLTTIEHACLLTTALASPVSCPADSLVGEAKVNTPVLAAPLSGPIYIVAHGGTTLPTLVMILQGDGVHIELAGSLAISRKGTVSAAFRTLPDVPISSLELDLPSGPHSVLGAIESLCSKQLALPYTFADQSGVAVKGSARVSVSGCPKRKATADKSKAKRPKAKPTGHKARAPSPARDRRRGR